MEKYYIEKNDKSISINRGKYFDLLNNINISQYGENGANNICNNVEPIFRSALELEVTNNVKKNILLVGKVQSGKTSNLELFTALSFDNGFNLVIIYGGYDSKLLSQTIKRFKKDFNIPEKNNYQQGTPVLFTTGDIEDIDNEMISELLDKEKPIFLIAMKKPYHLNKVNSFLNKIDHTKLRAFIIDDEGDQASLNTSPDKTNFEEASRTYHAISEMKRVLNNPIYLSVTATPHALVFLDEYSELLPYEIHLIEPGKSYCGADEFHLNDLEHIVVLPGENNDEENEDVMSDSLRLAIQYYIICCALLLDVDIDENDHAEMVIHTHKNKSEHNNVYGMVHSEITKYQDIISNYQEDDINTIKEQFKHVFNNYIDMGYKNKIDYNLVWERICNQIIKRIHLILYNSAGGDTQGNEDLKKYKIYIGGDLLQRGITFKHLLATYFTRWAKTGGTMDTNLQRARWFGYRKKYIKLCKIFTTEIIALEFSNLAEVENVLWEQFYNVQNHELNIKDIVIEATNTNQRPTRRNVVDCSRIMFRNSWDIYQKQLIFDSNINTKNNKKIDGFVSKYSLQKTTVGSNNNAETAYYFSCKTEDIISLIESLDNFLIEDNSKKEAILKMLGENDNNIVYVEILDNAGKPRERSYYSESHKVKVLFEGYRPKGADDANITYKGDKEVIIDKNSINIQLHRIVPKDEDKKLDIDNIQYMFAFYVPITKIVYIRD